MGKPKRIKCGQCWGVYEHDADCDGHPDSAASLRSRLSAVEKERDEARAAEVDAQVAANDALTAKKVAEAALDGVAAGIRGWRCYHCNRFAALEETRARVAELEQFVEETVADCREANEKRDAEAYAHVTTIGALRKAEARVAELEKLYDTGRTATQHFVDAACYYRNAFIKGGAKPEQMLNDFDRKLCEQGVDQGLAPGEWSVADAIAETEKLWDAEAKADRLEAALRDLLVWAEWQKRRAGGVRMNESNTGAIEAARAALEAKP